MCHWIIDQNVYILAQDPVAEKFSFGASMTALDLVDWPAWKRIATGFFRLHPRVQVRDLA